MSYFVIDSLAGMRYALAALRGGTILDL